MKRFFKFIKDMMDAVGEASYAAHLARNGQFERAKSVIQK
jgi:hypothetical protein